MIGLMTNKQDLEHPYVDHEKLNNDTDRVKELLAEEFEGYTLPALRLLLRRTVKALAKEGKAQRQGSKPETIQLRPVEELEGGKLSYIG